MAQRDERLGESQEVRVEFVGFPIEPGDRIVLAIGVVVSKLGTANFITHQEHRNALAQQESRQEVSELSGPFSLDGLAGRRAFDSVVQAVVVVLPIAVVFTIGFIVFGLVADQVVERESIVTGDKIDAARGASSGGFIEIGRSG